MPASQHRGDELVRLSGLAVAPGEYGGPDRGPVGRPAQGDAGHDEPADRRGAGTVRVRREDRGGSARSNSSRRALTFAAPIETRRTTAATAPPDAAFRSPVRPPGQRRQRLVPVPRREQTRQVLRRCAKEPNRSSNRAPYHSSGPGAAGQGRRHVITHPRAPSRHYPRHTANLHQSQQTWILSAPGYLTTPECAGVYTPPVFPGSPQRKRSSDDWYGISGEGCTLSSQNAKPRASCDCL